MSEGPVRLPSRPLPVGPIRAFEAVARLLSFRGAAEELHLTQSAVSRQIATLEDDVGAQLFQRGTRHVELTADGATLLRAVAPALDRLDAAVRQIRVARGRKVVSVTTFSSFATLWLIPRLEAFQREHEDLDIRVSAVDRMISLEDADLDLALRYCPPDQAPPRALRLFDEVVTPIVGRWMWSRIQSGEAPPLERIADLAQHVLADEEDSTRPSTFLTWRHWLEGQGEARLQPRRWIVFNYTHQQVQAALTGHAIALGRLPLVSAAIAQGDLIEPFGTAGRVASSYAYWLVPSAAGQARPEVAEFARWVLAQAEETRACMSDAPAVVKSKV